VSGVRHVEEHQLPSPCELWRGTSCCAGEMGTCDNLAAIGGR
jgi:hypothetical protein